MTIVIPTDNFVSLTVSAMSTKRKSEVLAVADGIYPATARSIFDSVPGPEPFCFSRNVNLGIKVAGGEDIIVWNQDAILESGSVWSLQQSCTPEYGLVSAAINGANCNPDACTPRGSPVMVDTDITVPFVCVYIPRRTLDLIGLLDERLTGYGREDDVYCMQVRAAGLKTGVWHGCVVEHGSLPSSYRTRPDCGEKAAYNLRVFAEIVREKGLQAQLSADQRRDIERAGLSV